MNVSLKIPEANLWQLVTSVFEFLFDSVKKRTVELVCVRVKLHVRKNDNQLRHIRYRDVVIDCRIKNQLHRFEYVCVGIVIVAEHASDFL